MDPSTLFDLAGPPALLGWIALALSPLAPRVSQIVAAIIVPTLLGIAYTALILTGWAEAEGGYGSLADVMLLFANPTLALAGWLHYLAFDLVVGAWEVRTARREGIPHLFVLPCLVLTFLFGPIGFVLFLSIRALRPMVGARSQEV